MQAAAPKIEKTKCCAKMKAKAGGDDCAQHAPKSDQEKQCCAGCVICVAVLPTSAMAFVYPPTGDESFARFFVRELIRSDRPQVPPPRCSVA
jgi:ferredoxin